jgi:hypothetical protein
MFGQRDYAAARRLEKKRLIGASGVAGAPAHGRPGET